MGVTPAPPKGEAENSSFFRLFLFSFASKTQTYSAENQIKDASPWQAASLFIYLNEHNRRHTGEKRNTHFILGGWHSSSAV